MSLMKDGCFLADGCRQNSVKADRFSPSLQIAIFLFTLFQLSPGPLEEGDYLWVALGLFQTSCYCRAELK